MSKLGSYIEKLMTTIIDSETEDFIRDLALSELRRLNVNIEEFIRTHSSEETQKVKKSKTKEKQLLQEDDKDAK